MVNVANENWEDFGQVIIFLCDVVSVVSSSGIVVSGISQRRQPFIIWAIFSPKLHKKLDQEWWRTSLAPPSSITDPPMVVSIEITGK